MKKRALISVSDKTGVVEFAKDLISLGYEIISTGGTAKILSDNNVENIGISEITGFPECLDGRVKTLHPAVHAGLLAMRSNPSHMAQLKELNINTIDIVAVNLYPFKATIMKPNVALADAVENIDIGGPTMLRSAAKNYQDVAVVVDPSDYQELIKRLKTGALDVEYKFGLMYKVFAHTSAYDTLIATYLQQQLGITMPKNVAFAFEKVQDLRYGENPHQSAAFYKEIIPVDGSLSEAKQLNGKELSFNNINDANGALDLLREFGSVACVAAKHANPCGVGLGDDVLTCYKRAYECDPVSIFGGIVVVNREIDAKTAEEMIKIFLEIVIAPSFSDEALKILAKKPNLRVLELPTINAKVKKGTLEMKKVLGGMLVQDKDLELYEQDDLTVVTTAQPTVEQMEQMEFAYKVVKHTKSNGIVVAKDNMAIGIGGGQTNRIWAASQAIEHAGERAKGAVLASDAFFPFSDCVEVAGKAGITAIIQPGGSIRDAESIELCNKLGIAMVFCNGKRHFKH